MAGQEGIEAIKARLGNIRSVEPILGAMRTISLGSWQAALKRKDRVLAYSERLLSLLPPLAPHLESRRRRKTTLLGYTLTAGRLIWRCRVLLRRLAQHGAVA